MKLLVLVSSLGGGGAERVAVNLANAWSRAGHQVAVCPTFLDTAASTYPLDPALALARLPYNSSGRRPWQQLRRLLALRALIRAEQPDCIVSFLTNVNVAALLAARGLGVAVVVSERTHPPLVPLGTWLQRLRAFTYPGAAAVVVQTQRTADWMGRALPRCRTHVIPNPLVLPLPSQPPELRPEDHVHAGARVILGIGRLGAEKGFEDLISAFAEIRERHEDCHLVLLGEGPERAALLQQIDDAGLAACIHLPGWAGNLADWLERAEVFVLSSRFEGFPNALLEAMAHGLAVVSYDCETGPAELICHDDNGALVPPARGPAGLAAAIHRLLEDTSLRQRLGSNAMGVRDRYAMPRILAEWQRLLELATAGGAR